MKSDGRALDLVVVGLGQAGGNLASEFFRRGYRALAFNTAHTDLTALDPGGVYPTMPVDRRIYIGIDGYDGAGADPTYGRECIREHTERIRSLILKEASDADVVILAAGLGGGTGSALAELVNLLKDDGLPLVALMTLPTEGESGIAKVNAVRAINEIVDTSLLGRIFVDNARIASLNPNVSIVDYYAHINDQIAAPIDAFNRLNARDTLKAIRSFDGEDFRRLFLSGGLLNYGTAELPCITRDEVVGTIRDCIEDSELMPGGFTMSRLTYLGVVIEGTDASLSRTPISVFEEIVEELKKETGGGAVYHGIYRSSESAPATLRIIAATLSLPDRVRQILIDAKREGMLLGEKIRDELPSLELGEVASLELFRTSPRISDRPRKSQRAASSTSPSSAPSSSPSSSSAPSKQPRRTATRASDAPLKPILRKKGDSPIVDLAGDKDATTLGTEEIDLVAELAKLPRIPGSKTDPAAGISAEYERLVADYRESSDTNTKRQITRRLEEDSLSANAIARYYAVEAMSKLGREIFNAALLAATEDDDDAVRAIAKEALLR